MAKAEQGSNNLGSEVTSPRRLSRRVQGTNGDAIVVLLGAKNGIKTGIRKPSKILSGWTRQKWRSQFKSTHKKTCRSGRSA
jgi:hypothetical protein